MKKRAKKVRAYIDEAASMPKDFKMHPSQSNFIKQISMPKKPKAKSKVDEFQEVLESFVRVTGTMYQLENMPHPLAKDRMKLLNQVYSDLLEEYRRFKSRERRGK